MEIFNSPGKGRGLRVTKEFWAGDVLFAEPPLACVPFDSLTDRICHSCFRSQPKLLRCGQCRFAFYCDKTCQRAAWDEHKNECGAIKTYGKAPNESIRLVARIFWRLDKEGPLVSDTQITTVDELENHVPDMPEEEHKELRVDIHNFLDFWPRNSKQHNSEEVSHLLGVVNCNGFSVSDQRGLNAVGVGLFPNLCLINHDCWPNCTVVLNHGKIELRALGKISVGEEVTVSYVDFLNLTEDRQRQLKSQYFFDCTCQSCKDHHKDDLKLAGKAETPEGEKIPEETVKETNEWIKQMLRKCDQARIDNEYHQVARICKECIEKCEPILADTNIYMLRVWNTYSEVQAYLQFNNDAAEYSRKMMDGYLKLYHPNNANLGMTAMRSGVSHWQAGRIETGHGMICKAYAILQVTHGPTHPITKDLEQIRMQTEMELRMFKQNEYVYYQMREAALRNRPMSMNNEPTVEDNIKNLFHQRKRKE